MTVTSNISEPAGSRMSARAARSATSVSHSSSWSSAAPSISSAAPSLPATYNSDAGINAGGGEEEDENRSENEYDPTGIDAANLDPSPDPNPNPRIYTCLFHMLDCHESFADEQNWTTHVLSHFRTHPPPQTARCPLCPNTKFVDGDPNPLSSPVPSPDEKDDEPETVPELEPSRASIRRVDSGTDVRDDGPYTGIDIGIGLETELGYTGSAWRRLLDHVGAHYRTGQTLAGSRADFELMRYLYGRRIISDAQFKAMQLAPAPSSPAYHASQDGVRASIGSSDEPYCAPYSRRREERMRGQQKGVSVGVV